MNRQRLEQAYIRKEIAYWAISLKEGVTIKIVRSHLKDMLSFKISWYQIRRYLKSLVKLSYKKGCTRLVDINQNKLSFIRISYSIQIAKQMNEDVLMINIEEVSLNTEVINRRSWLKVRVNWELWNQNFKETLSLILATSSNEVCIGASILDKLNSNISVEFLKMVIAGLIIL